MATTSGNMKSFKVTDKNGNVFVMTPVDTEARQAIDEAKNLYFDEDYFTSELSQDETEVSVGLNGVPIGVDTDTPLEFVQDDENGIVLGSKAPFATSIADEFATSSTYDLNDKVMYKGNFYICTSAISTTGNDWNIGNWSATNVNDIVAGVSLIAGTDIVINNGVIGVNTNGNAIGNYSFVEGVSTEATAYASHAEGMQTKAYGTFSHAEGQITSAINIATHSEGLYTLAQGIQSHAEGLSSNASGSCSHAEGARTSAIETCTHAEGSDTIAYGKASHAEGSGTIAGDDYMHVGGSYNYTSSNAVFVIGNGTDDEHRSDAFIISADGTVSAKRFIEADPALTITGGDYVSVAEDTTNNKLIIDVDSDLGTMFTTLSSLLSAGALPTTGRHILGVTNGTLGWLEVNQ